MNIQARKFDFNNVEALTDKQINEHYKLYVKYVDKTNETQSILNTQNDLGQPNSTYSFVRGVKDGETYAYNAVKLHEYYFDNLGKVACDGKS